jgi:hypothetical protein
MKPEQHTQLVKKVLSRWNEELLVYHEAFKQHTFERADRMSNPISLPEWLVLVNDTEYSTVAYEKSDDIEILTSWEGYPFRTYSLLVTKKKMVIAVGACENEKEAVWLHQAVGFYIDQKMWEE